VDWGTYGTKGVIYWRRLTSVSTGPAWYWKKISCRHTVAAKNTY
jgi:hypothetical protein